MRRKKECPCCRSSRIRAVTIEADGGKRYGYTCDRCCMCSPYLFTRKEAAVAWWMLFYGFTGAVKKVRNEHA
jgi:hypothetical protein